MKRFGNQLAAHWTGGLFWVLILAGVGLLMWFRLGTLVPGVSTNELTTATASSSVEKLIDNPLGLPHKGIQYAIQRIQVSPLAIRSASAIIGVFTIGCFYYVLRNWYTRRIALLGTLLFATSPWFLHVARLGTDTSMYLLLFGAVAVTVWMKNSKGSLLSVIAAMALILALLYIPGMVWFVVPAFLWQLTRLGSMLEGWNAGILTVLALLLLVALGPIGYAIFREPELAKAYFGLPNAVPTITEVLRNIVDIPVQLFFRGPQDPEVWLGRLPLLGIFTSVMFLVGVYAYFFMRKLDRSAFFVFVFVFGTILIGIGGPVNVALFMPFIYLLAAGGVALMLQQWFTVFPRNPFARGTGALLVTIVVLLVAYGNITHYFIAWPNAPETKAVFQQKL